MAGSPSAIFAVAATGATGVAAAGFAGAAGAVEDAAAGAALGATVVCADAINPAVASSVKISVFFNMSVLQKHGNKTTLV